MLNDSQLTGAGGISLLRKFDYIRIGDLVEHFDKVYNKTLTGLIIKEFNHPQHDGPMFVIDWIGSDLGLNKTVTYNQAVVYYYMKRIS